MVRKKPPARLEKQQKSLAETTAAKGERCEAAWPFLVPVQSVGASVAADRHSSTSPLSPIE